MISCPRRSLPCFSSLTCSIAKCEREKIEHIIENHSSEEFNITIINVQMANPDYPEQTCTLINVNDCFVVYPSKRFLLGVK